MEYNIDVSTSKQMTVDSSGRKTFNLNMSSPAVVHAISVTNVQINSDGNLIVTLSDGSTINAGHAVGGIGPTGVSIVGVRQSGYDLYLILSNGQELLVQNVRGPQGEHVVLRANSTHIQWKSESADTWNNLIALSDLTGDAGVGIESITFDHIDASGGNVYNVNLTDGTSYQFTAPRGASGSGSGDMQSEDYDPQGTVAEAGGIAAYVEDTVPTELSDLNGDSAHRTVSDTEKATWSGKQPKITASGILKGNGDGGVSAAVAGEDYQAPLTSGTNIKTINNESILGSGNLSVASSWSNLSEKPFATVGSGLTVSSSNALNVDVETSAVSGSVKPITSGAVYTILGNVEALLAEI